MDFRLDFGGKRVLVTGGTRGIGRATVEAFHGLGATVAVNGTTAEGVAKAIAAIGGGKRLVPAPGDLATVAACRRVVEGAVSAMGGLDVLVNNAGLGDDCPIDEVDEAFWERMTAVNLRAPLFCAKFAAPALRQSKGNIVNVASMLGVIGGPAGTTVYATTKGGLVNMTRVLALELAPDGVRVNALCPGWILTDMIRHDNEQQGGALFKEIERTAPLARVGTVEECAGSILYLASNRHAGYTTGAVLVNDGGISSGH